MRVLYLPAPLNYGLAQIHIENQQRTDQGGVPIDLTKHNLRMEGQQEKAGALPAKRTGNFAAEEEAMSRKWRFVTESLPLNPVGCDLLFEDGFKGYGWYYGNIHPSLIDGWMLYEPDVLPHENVHGPIVKWRKRP